MSLGEISPKGERYAIISTSERGAVGVRLPFLRIKIPPHFVSTAVFSMGIRKNRIWKKLCLCWLHRRSFRLGSVLLPESLSELQKRSYQAGHTDHEDSYNAADIRICLLDGFGCFIKAFPEFTAEVHQSVKYHRYCHIARAVVYHAEKQAEQCCVYHLSYGDYPQWRAVCRPYKMLWGTDKNGGRVQGVFFSPRWMTMISPITRMRTI